MKKLFLFFLAVSWHALGIDPYAGVDPNGTDPTTCPQMNSCHYLQMTEIEDGICVLEGVNHYKSSKHAMLVFPGFCNDSALSGPAMALQDYGDSTFFRTANKSPKHNSYFLLNVHGGIDKNGCFIFGDDTKRLSLNDFAKMTAKAYFDHGAGRPCILSSCYGADAGPEFQLKFNEEFHKLNGCKYSVLVYTPGHKE